MSAAIRPAMPPSVHPLFRILNPSTVAVIGASESTSKFGGRVMNFLLKHGFKGTIRPINPSAASVLGTPAYRSIADAPGPIDVAIMALPAAHIESAVEQCGRAGVAGCVVLTADFAEAGDEGAARQEALVSSARAHGMRLIGPNCLGFINPDLRLALTSSVALAVEPMPTGSIGLVSQSGSLMAALISHAQDLGTGFSIAASVGNQADLEICDFIDYFVEDDKTRAICAYIEGIRDGRRFLEVAARCRRARKPLLVVKAGNSDAAAHITRSHTASLAGNEAAWRAACEKHAIISLDDPEAMIQCADFLVRFGAPHGDGVAALSPSGGTIAVTADRIVAAGLRLAAPNQATTEALHAIVPPSRPVNPLDVGGLAREAGLESAGRCFELLADDSDVAVVMIVVATTPQLNEKVKLWGELALKRGKPAAILFTPGALVDDARSALRQLECPFTNRMDDSLRVIKAAIDYGVALARPVSEPQLPEGFGDPDAFAAPDSRLTESEAKKLLALAGIRTTGERHAASPDEAVAAAKALGFPVVLKLSSRTLTHKSDVGGVELDLRSSDDVVSAWQRMAQRIASIAGAAPLECVVQPMMSGGIEMIVGARWDPQFGALVMVGAGGIWAETLRDTQCALAPVSTQSAHALIDKLRSAPLLLGARGKPPADIEALIDTVVRVSWLATKLGPRLAELDINPLLVRAAGHGAVALDARATLSLIPDATTKAKP